MTHVKHTIQKLTVDVQTSSVSLGHEIRENARLFIDQQVMPLIESYLEKLQSELSGDEVLQLNRLTVNISTSPDRWDSDSAVLELRTELDKSLEEATREVQMQRSIQKKVAASQTLQNNFSETLEGVKIKKRSEHLLEIWFNILESGMGSLSIPTQNVASPETLEEQLLNWLDTALPDKKKQLSKRLSNHAVQQRLVNQYSPEFIARMLQEVFLHTAPLRSNIDAGLFAPFAVTQNMSAKDVRTFWSKILGFIQFENKSLLSDARIALELITWLQASTVSLPLGFSKKEEFVILLKRLSLPENYSFAKAGWQQQATRQEERLVELSFLTVLTIEWLHQLTGKIVSLKAYGTLLSTLLKPVDSSISGKTDQSELLNPVNESTGSQEYPLHKVSEPKKSFEEENTIAKDIDGTLEKDSGKQEQLTNEKEQIEQSGHSIQQNEEKVPKSDATHISLKEKSKKSSLESDDLYAETVKEQQEAGNDSGSLENTENQILGEISESEKKTVQAKPKSMKEVVSTTLRKLEEEGDFIWVQNAGVILTHPFLKHLFLRIGVLNDSNELTDPVLAAHVLHFVATGQECDFEHEMILEKILCGLAPEDSIPREVPISEEIRMEVNGFFEAIKSNWKPLAGSSDEAMRETFFRREGKLLMDESGLRLIVERKTVDILLNQLSWPVSIVRLPWLKDILYVEW